MKLTGQLLMISRRRLFRRFKCQMSIENRYNIYIHVYIIKYYLLISMFQHVYFAAQIPCKRRGSFMEQFL